jgi:hypothetical protein
VDNVIGSSLMVLRFGSAVVVVVKATLSAHAAVAMVLDMVFGGVIRMPGCELCVAVRNERLMRSVRVVAFLIVLGSIAVMPRR